MLPKKLSSASVTEIELNFTNEYRLRYGRDINNIPIETVTWRVLVSGPFPALIPNQAIIGQHKKMLKGNRQVFWGSKYETTPVYDRYSMPLNKKIKGPCIIEEFESTTVVGHNSYVVIDPYKNIIINMQY